MKLQIGNFMIWCSPGEASAYGATHHARMHGLIPGFSNPKDGLWISRSDLLIPIEELLSFVWVLTRQLRGEEPDFMFSIGKPLQNVS